MTAPVEQITTPVAFIVFNRPDTTRRVFEEIASAKPPKLLIVGDGPRLNRPGEQEKVTAVRTIVERVDWECEVLTNYSDVNLGCKRRVSSGLDWVFDEVEEAIVLEDDCLPHPSFFRYCEELLQRYRNDERVGAISGDNFQFGTKRTSYSYYFSRYNHVWGWASWRRAWKHYDVDVKLWPEIRNNGWLYSLLGDRRKVQYWTEIFNLVYDGRIDTWDYQWTFALWMQHALTALPNVNLISNIGFGADATHTAGKSRVAELPVEQIGFPLHHPPFIIRDQQADERTDEIFFTRSLGARLKAKVRCLIQ